MAIFVLDGGAVLGYLLEEAGWKRVERALAGRDDHFAGRRGVWKCVMSAAVFGEVVEKLVGRGMAAEKAVAAVEGMGVKVVAMDGELARRAGELGRHFGVEGWGARGSLALAERMRDEEAITVLMTREKRWEGFGVSWVEVVGL